MKSIISSQIAKTYVVVRGDLKPGLQAAQAGHALTDLILKYPEQARDWRDNSNFLIILSVENEEKILALVKELDRTEMAWTEFREPDINNELTALAVLPNRYTEKFFRNLPLALREVK